MKCVTLYCDGSSLGNPGAGGWCGILEFNGVQKIVQGNAKIATNNQMELQAVISSLSMLKEPCEVHLYSDSKYVVEGINTWLKNWEAKNFKKVKNPKLWQEYLKISKPHTIIAHWVQGHAGITLNEQCDSIAKAQALKAQQES